MTETSHIESAEVRGLVDLARKARLQSRQDGDDRGELERLVQAQRRALVHRRRRPYFWGAGALAIAAGMILLLRQMPRHDDALTYAMKEGDRVTDVAGPAPGQYVFSDGSSVSLVDDAAIEVVSAEQRAPRIRLTRGNALVKVIHRADTRWTFAAGPFEVDVVGTTFELHWDPTLRDFSLDLREGIVEVRGPILDGTLRLPPGHKVSVSIDSGRVSIVPPTDDLETPAPAQPVAILSPSAAPNARRMPERVNPSADAGSLPGSWRSLVGHGHFEQVISEALARPLESCLAKCSPADLRALGDAARYSNRSTLAEQALRALRHRFPGTTDGTVAAFLLGRTYEARHSWDDASLWYSRYLAEAPAGEFAVEAASGKARVAEMR